MARYPVAETAYLVVSKSGETPETLLQLSCVLSFLAEQNTAPDKHIVTLTEDKPSSLTRISQKLGLMTLPHDKNIGGRFSVLTNVGLLPARLAGVDIARVRQGAAQALDDFLNHDDAAQNMPLSGAALQIAHAQAGRNISVLMPYDERLDKLGLWFRQLWAESLGKKGRGTTLSMRWGQWTSTASYSFILMGQMINSTPLSRPIQGQTMRHLLPIRVWKILPNYHGCIIAPLMNWYWLSVRPAIRHWLIKKGLCVSSRSKN